MGAKKGSSNLILLKEYTLKIDSEDPSKIKHDFTIEVFKDCFYIKDKSENRLKISKTSKGEFLVKSFGKMTYTTTGED